MSFFRSEEMTLCSMVLHKESAFECLIELGNLAAVQFNIGSDESEEPNLQFINEVQRCSELQRIVKYLQMEIDDCGMKTVFYPDVDTEEIPQVSDLKDIELLLNQVEKEVLEVQQNCNILRVQMSNARERHTVLLKADTFLSDERGVGSKMAWSDSIIMNLIRNESRGLHSDNQLHLSFFTGTIPIERFMAFELMLWRLCHSNFYLKKSYILDAMTDTDRLHTRQHKYAFMVFFVGDIMRHKIEKVCQGFRAILYDCPESSEAREAERQKCATEIEDIKLILARADEHRRRILIIAAADLFIWKVKVKKILMVYVQLNKFTKVRQLDNQKYFQAECWIPTGELPAVRSALLRGAKRASRGDDTAIFPPMLTVKPFNPTERDAPTHFRTNKLTRGFQNLVDAYGIATYMELNPAPFSIITFPFLFAVMFGDIGHGTIMAAFGIWMVLKEEKLEEQKHKRGTSNEIWNILFAGRYIIMMMGIFSIYTGLIYNDIFSKSLNFIGSKWRVNYTRADVLANEELQLDPARLDHYLGTPHIFGIDPVWDASGENAIIFLNSFKMKLAIILGVAQMIFGLCLSSTNYTFYDNNTDFYLIFVPQIVFLTSIFGYLVFLIIIKWTSYGGNYKPPYTSNCAPSVLMMFIDMLLFKSSKPPREDCLEHIYAAQEIWEVILVFVAILCVPVLAVGKPLILRWKRAKIQRMRDAEAKKAMTRNTLKKVQRSMVFHLERESMHMIPSDAMITEEDISEVWIHQAIHCIESILGSVSHTASYLRLWALSLAHDQLATVLWNMVLGISLRGHYGWWNCIVLYLVFGIWAVLTIAILVVMEGLSAFLHTLRLHWVEFQSKFYSGTGTPFRPFRFEPSLSTA